MKVILDIDSVKYPLTGIGRYTYELARIFRERACFEELLFICGFKILADLPSAEETGRPDSEGSLKGHLIKLARESRLPHKVFHASKEKFWAHRLANYRDFLFHGPNYSLPSFPGPKVVTIPDLSTMVVPKFHEKFKAELINKRIIRSIREADCILAISRYAAQEIVECLEVPKQKVHVTPLAASAAFYPRSSSELRSVLANWGLEPGRYCLFTGTIEPRKNIDVLLDAYEGLPDNVRQAFPLVLCGYHGWKSEALHQRIRALSEKGWVRYLGYADAGDLPILMAGAALFLFPSFYEGFGLPPLEAMQSGVPVMVSDRTSLPEVVGDAGMKLHPQDVSSWTEGIRRGLEDSVWREEAIDLGLKRSSEFSWEVCATKTILAYQKVSA